MTATLDEIKAASVVKPVRLARLQVDTIYQRVPSMKLVDQIEADWNLIASELILVSDRGPREDGSGILGGLFVVNGQHRLIAALRLGLEELDARVINLRKESNPVAIEAALRLQTGVRLSDKTFERFKAQLAAGDEDSLKIVKILTSYGTKPMTGPGEEGITAIATIERLFRVDDGPLLSETLQVILDAWGDFDGRKSSSAIMKGIAWFIKTHVASADTPADRARLVSKLRSLTATQLDARARQFAGTMGGALWLNVHLAILDLYNDGLGGRNKLQFSKKGASKFGSRSDSVAFRGLG